MVIVRIQHPVFDYDKWKRLFDDSGGLRARHGARRYQVLRPVDDPNYVMVDLDFDTRATADAFLTELRAMWAGPGREVASDQQGRITEVVEQQEC